MMSRACFWREVCAAAMYGPARRRVCGSLGEQCVRVPGKWVCGSLGGMECLGHWEGSVWVAERGMFGSLRGECLGPWEWREWIAGSVCGWVSGRNVCWPLGGKSAPLPPLKETTFKRLGFQTTRWVYFFLAKSHTFLTDLVYSLTVWFFFFTIHCLNYCWIRHT